MATTAELDFIMRFHDEATRVLGRVAGSLGTVGSSASAATGNVNNLGAAVRQATAAITALFTANKLVGGSLDAFREYDMAMTVVARVTEASANEMEIFTKKFDEMVDRVKAVPLDRFQEIAQQAAQLGIQGSDDIVKFSETVGKLETSLKDLGDQAPKLIVRVLNATGEGVAGVEKFGNVLVRMGKDASASEERILSMTAMLAQATAKFKIGGAALLGLSTAAANLNFVPQLFGTAVQRTLTNLEDAAIANSEGMRVLSEMTGLANTEFLKMIRSQPDQALLLFFEALRAVNDSGKSATAFLGLFNLQAQENIRVIGTAAQNYEQFADYVDRAMQESREQVALTQEFTRTMEAFNTTVTSTGNAWNLLKKTFGAALAPVATKALEGLTASFNFLRKAIEGAPSWLSTTMATFVSAIPVFIGLTTAVRALAIAFPLLWAALTPAWLIKIIGAFGSLAGWLIRLVPLVVGLIAAIGAVPITIAATAAAIAGFGILVYENWEKVKEILAMPVDEAVMKGLSTVRDSMGSWFSSMGAWVSDKWADVLEGFSQRPKLPDLNDNEMKAAASLSFGLRGSKLPGGDKPVSAISDNSVKAIKDMDKMTEALKKLREQRNALEEMNKLPTDDSFFRQLKLAPDQVDEYRKRLMGLQEIQERIADPANARIKGLKEETLEAGAYLIQQKNRVELENRLSEATEERGKLEAHQIAEITADVQRLQSARANAAMGGLAFDQALGFGAAMKDMQNELDMIGKTAGETARLGYIRQQMAAAEETAARNGTTVQKEMIELIKMRGEAYGALKQQIAEANTIEQLGFERMQLFRTQSSQIVASTLRSAGIASSSEMGQFLSMQIKINEALKDAHEIGQGVFRDLGRAALDSKNAMDILADSLKRVANRLMDVAMDGIWNQLFGAAFGGLGGMPGANSQFGAISNPNAWAGMFHGGGLVGANDNQRRVVPSSVFDNAVKMHGGGVAGLRMGEVPAILKRNEEVLTESDPRHTFNGGGGVAVNFSPTTNITIEGNTDSNTLGRIRSELDQRDAQLRREMPSIVAKANRDRVRAA